MATLTENEILGLLEPYVGADELLLGRLLELTPKFSVYLDLLLRWNARTNLTAIREPREIVQRHFGESIFVAGALRERLTARGTLLDFGSGAGFPGLPMQICLPELTVCLAESQGKKASFLREAVRTLSLHTEVWAGRVEDMPQERSFDVVTLRAVDHMETALQAAGARVSVGSLMAVLAGKTFEGPDGWLMVETLNLPGGDVRSLVVLSR